MFRPAFLSLVSVAAFTIGCQSAEDTSGSPPAPDAEEPPDDTGPDTTDDSGLIDDTAPPDDSGVEVIDADGDGYDADSDCDDADPSVNPGADEVCENGVDDDCDGADANCRLTGTLALGDADGVLVGTMAGARLGEDVALDGDATGNGVPDVVVTEDYSRTWYYKDETFRPARAWIIDGLDADQQGAVDEVASAVIVGPEADDGNTFNSPDFAVVVGDVDLDGYDDLVDGGYAYSSPTAFVHLGPLSGTIEADAAEASFSGEAPEAIAYYGSMWALGEVAMTYDTEAVVVMDGWVEGEFGTDDAAALLTGNWSMYLGRALDLGDLNGDGSADACLGAEGLTRGSSEGGVFVVYGPLTQDVAVTTMDGLGDGDALVWGDSGAYAGYNLDCSHDHDGDGRDDMMVLLGNDVAYVLTETVTGETSFAGSRVSVLPGSGVVHLRYPSLSADLDGDGQVDLVVGGEDTDERVLAHVFYGPLTGTITTDDASATIIDADDIMRMFASGTDIDGDGADELLIGATLDETVGEWAGATYLFFGGTVDPL